MHRRTFLKRILTSLIGMASGSLSAAPAWSKPAPKTGQRVDPSERLRAIRRELHQSLHETLHAWFPRCLDVEFGGFLTNFDARWNATGPHEKTLEYQARQVRAARSLVFVATATMSSFSVRSISRASV